MPTFTSDRPDSNENLRSRIYTGEVFLLPASESSKALVDTVIRRLAALGLEPDSSIDTLRKGSKSGQLAEIHEKIKGELIEDEQFDRLIVAILRDLGFATERTVYDALRLRIVVSGDYDNPSRKRSYSIHRDTWYANSASQVNFWLPLHDVSSSDSFSFYPECFGRSIANTSDKFDYDSWMSTVGWQNASGQGFYPTVSAGGESSPSLSVEAKAGDLLIFSAAQLHRTNPNVSGKTRFSLDFRVVDEHDHEAGRGARDVDNLSTGCSIKDYRRCHFD